MNTAKDLLLDYVRYNVWANKRIGEVLDQLDPVKYDQPVASSFPSIRKTVFHIWDAEYLWFMRFQGESLTKGPTDALPAETRLSDFVSISEKMLRFAESRDDAFFSGETAYRNIKGEPFTSRHTEMLMHCMNHSAFHRGQLVTMIRETGWTGKLPSTDLITYYRERK